VRKTTVLKEMYKFHSFARVYKNRACIYAYVMHCSCVMKRADKNNFSNNFRTDPTEYWKNLDPTPTRHVGNSDANQCQYK